MIGVFTLYQPLCWFSSLLHVLSLNITVCNNHGYFQCVVSIAIFDVFITGLFSTRSETLSRYLSNTRFFLYSRLARQVAYILAVAAEINVCVRAPFLGVESLTKD